MSGRAKLITLAAQAALESVRLPDPHSLPGPVERSGLPESRGKGWVTAGVGGVARAGARRARAGGRTCTTWHRRCRLLCSRTVVAEHRAATKTVLHPHAGEIALEIRVLTTQGSDLRIVVCTSRPGTDARGKLDLLAAIGTQTMTTRWQPADAPGPGHVGRRGRAGRKVISR
ncbi:hypothetical protein KIH74_13895 [Kineosporia sp. J2-2]|uniref:MmyB-like transcription regulator ligand binding domain-containing protein n=1 Tax=Kineosporia corallincola TaxID=2835133 RepID=A0ABS5TG06_9ACTN|nr:hypothetical protein [Kineosporia corallincola]MBT0770026.1 hypothetical protein [Kineosporia corallincola]